MDGYEKLVLRKKEKKVHAFGAGRADCNDSRVLGKQFLASDYLGKGSPKDYSIAFRHGAIGHLIYGRARAWT